MQYYKNYNEFLNDNIGLKKAVLSIGSSVDYNLSGETIETISNEFKNLIHHNFINHNLYMFISTELQTEYILIVDNFIKRLINSDELFTSFWKIYIIDSNRYDARFEFKSQNHTIDNKNIPYELTQDITVNFIEKNNKYFSMKFLNEYFKYLKNN